MESYDDGVPEPIDYLAESLAKGLVVDQWYPTYVQTEVAAETVEELKAEQAKIVVPASEEPAETPEEPAAEAPAEGEEPMAEVPAGYTGLHLMLKNKSGKEIEKVSDRSAGGGLYRQPAHQLHRREGRLQRRHAFGHQRVRHLCVRA